MPETTQGSAERSINAGSGYKETLTLPTTPQAIQREAAQAIADNLAQTPFPQPPQKISAGEDANAVLANIKTKGGVGATIVDAGEHLARAVDNLKGDIIGSSRIYITKESSGHNITMGKVARRVLSTGIAEKVSNLLAKIGPKRKV